MSLQKQLTADVGKWLGFILAAKHSYSMVT